MLDFAAGKYAVFVWPAYGLTALVLVAMTVDSLVRARRWRKAAQPPPAIDQTAKGEPS